MEQVLNQAAWGRLIEVSDSVANGTMGGLLGLPSLLDAIVNESNESSGNDDVSYVGHGVNDAVIANPHITRSDPGPSHLVI